MSLVRALSMGVGAVAPMLVAGVGEFAASGPIVAASVRAIAIAARALDAGAPPSGGAPGSSAEDANTATPLPQDVATPECLRHYAAMPAPELRGDASAGRVRVCRDGYLLSFNPATRDPDWVMEHLTPAKLTGPAERKDKFIQDPALAGIDAGLDDYRGGPFDRGHQAPAQDAKYDPRVMAESFYFSNMVPQVGIGFNRGAWKWLEARIRSWVCGGHDDLYVVTGPIYGERDTYIGRHVRVPGAFFKVVYEPTSGRGFGVVLPNQAIGGKIDDLQGTVVPIDTIEARTGLVFFDTFPLRQQEQLKSVKGTVWGRGENCVRGEVAPFDNDAFPAGPARSGSTDGLRR